MLLNCGVGEDSWEFLRLQGDPTSPSQRRSVLGVHWKGWCWSWHSLILSPPDVESWLIWKDPDAGKDWGQEKGTTEDEMAGWHHWNSGHGFGWTLGVGYGQGDLVCCSSWGCKGSDMIERLNWTFSVKLISEDNQNNHMPGSRKLSKECQSHFFLQCVWWVCSLGKEMSTDRRVVCED